MHKLKLQNKLSKSQTPENLKKFKQQRNKYKQQKNKCLTVLEGTEKNYFDDLNPKVIADNKKFWSVVKPLFSIKRKAVNTIVLPKKN